MTITKQLRKHPYHLVTISPWPILLSISALTTAFGATMYMHFYSYGGPTLIFGLINIAVGLTFWWQDVIHEAVYCGDHNTHVQQTLKLGFILFIFSEVMFFFSFFWTFFHCSLFPDPSIGMRWPPEGILCLNPYEIPLSNTIILIVSGIAITFAHSAILTGQANKALIGFVLTLILAVSFTLAQLAEYIKAPFSIADGIYGSIFFMSTGFHGIHVIIGTIFITVCFTRFLAGHFTKEHHVGLEASIWYWHFVDVVWLFLYVFIYWWGSFFTDFYSIE